MSRFVRLGIIGGVAILVVLALVSAGIPAKGLQALQRSGQVVAGFAATTATVPEPTATPKPPEPTATPVPPTPTPKPPEPTATSEPTATPVPPTPTTGPPVQSPGNSPPASLSIPGGPGIDHPYMRVYQETLEYGVPGNLQVPSGLLGGFNPVSSLVFNPDGLTVPSIPADLSPYIGFVDVAGVWGSPIAGYNDGLVRGRHPVVQLASLYRL
jgi:hypothetical protein